MTTFEVNVKVICDEIYNFEVQQITIDFVQDTVEELFGSEELTRDSVGAVAYEADILLEVFNPKFEKDIDLLKRLYVALNEWAKDIESNNIILGIPREQ